MEYFVAKNNEYQIKYVIKDFEKNYKTYKISEYRVNDENFKINKNDILEVYKPKNFSITDIKKYVNDNLNNIVKFINIRLHNIKMDILNFHNDHLISETIIKSYQINIPDFIDTKTNKEYILKYEINYVDGKNNFNSNCSYLKFKTMKSKFFYKKLFLYIQNLIDNKLIKWDKSKATEIQKIAFKKKIKIELIYDRNPKKFYYFKSGIIYLNYQVIFLHKKSEVIWLIKCLLAFYSIFIN